MNILSPLMELLRRSEYNQWHSVLRYWKAGRLYLKST